jgi:Eukaryotic rRNA processing protein EBP2
MPLPSNSIYSMTAPPEPGSTLNADGRGGGNPKRDAKDSKYGFGGRKRAGKRNDAASSADMEGFRTSRPEGRGGSLKMSPVALCSCITLCASFGIVLPTDPVLQCGKAVPCDTCVQRTTVRLTGRGRGRGGGGGGRGGGRGSGPSPGGVRAGRAKKGGGGKTNRPGKARRAAARG